MTTKTRTSRKHKRRFWTERDDDILRSQYAHGPAQCAKRLGRTVLAVYQRAINLGIVKTRRTASNATVIAAIRRRHPLGWSDTEIRDELTAQRGYPVDRKRIGKLRKQLGLANNNASPHRRAIIAAATAKQLQGTDCATLADLRRKQWSAWKRRHGCPTHLTLRAAQAMVLFRRHGQLTRVQLADAMGVPCRKRTDPCSMGPGGTVLAELQRAGIITRLPKAMRVPGDLQLHAEPKDPRRRSNQFKYIDLYFLNPEYQHPDRPEQVPGYPLSTEENKHGQAEQHAEAS